MAQLSPSESKRLASRIDFIANMRIKLIGSTKAAEFNRQFGKVSTWDATNTTSEMIDGVESRLRNWMRVNGQAH